MFKVYVVNTYLLWTKFENVDQNHEMVLKKREIAFFIITLSFNAFLTCIHVKVQEMYLKLNLL